MIHSRLFALALTMSALAGTPAMAQDWRRHDGWDRDSGRRGSDWGRHGGRGDDRRSAVLDFDPGAMTLRVGERGHFHVVLGRGTPHLHDVRLSAWPNAGLSLVQSGDGFDVTAMQPGSFRIIAEHGEGWRVARGEMTVTVVEPAPCVERIELTDARTGRGVGGEVFTLAPGQQLELAASGFDRHGHAVGFAAQWGLSSPEAGQLVDRGDNRMTLMTSTTACSDVIHSLVASDGRVSTTLQFRVEAAAPQHHGVARIDLVQITRSGSQPTGGVIHASRGEEISLAAIGLSRHGRTMSFDDRWSLSTDQLGHLHRGADQSMTLHLDTQYRGTVVVVVRDAATGIGQQVQICVE